MSNQIIQLQDENKRLRAALADCGTAVGAVIGPQCSLSFLECVSQEVRLVTERLQRERVAALQHAERAREERNRIGVEIRREWIGKTAALQRFHSFFSDRCEGLFAQFGMPAVDAYNTAAMDARAAKDPS
jgi:hypothetical protein